MTGKELLKLLKKNGWQVVRIKGSHHIMKNPSRPGAQLVVPVHTGELPAGTTESILKKANLK